MKSILTLFFIIGIVGIARAQVNPYVLNGSAMQLDCHCYRLTPDNLFESGSIWNKNKIDLTKSFDYYFNIYLGCRDLDGADGIAFVLQPISTSLGTVGNGLGFGGIVPSLGVTLDTYQNTTDGDPFYDHIGLQANGDVVHGSSNNLAGPLQMLPGRDNLEDCQWHVLQVYWDAPNTTLTVSMDGSQRYAVKNDIVNTIFGGNPLVYWGFTSSTGGSTNLQQMCTSLDAKFILPPNQKTCIGTPVTFVDSSVSFGSIVKWFWNFGDGTTDTIQNPPPHNYAQPGIYNVTLNILGNDGCISDTFKQQVTVGSYPVANFDYSPKPACTNNEIKFTDATTLQVGTKEKWFWDFGNGETSTLQEPPLQNYLDGSYTAKLLVVSKEGCASDTAKQTFGVLVGTSVDFISPGAACSNTPLNFSGERTGTIPIQTWLWNLGDGTFITDSVFTHAYKDSGIYNVSLVAQAVNGCITDTVSSSITIYSTNAFAGNDTTILMNYPYQLNASGGENYTWSPSADLSDPFIPNPVVTLATDATYIVTVSSSQGCETTDSIHLKVIKGPEIYVPTAFTPNADGRNDVFRIIPVGITEINTFSIFNRWGQMIFSSKDPSKGWDGNRNGTPQPQGTYVWIVSGKTIEGNSIKKQGTVVLIR